MRCRLEYGNNPSSIKGSATVGAILACFIAVGGGIAAWRSGHFDLAHLRLLAIVTIIPLALLVMVASAALIFRVRVINGQIQLLMFGRIISSGRAADFKSVTVTALGPCIVLKSKKMYLIAMKLSELNRLSHDLAEAKKNLDPL